MSEPVARGRHSERGVRLEAVVADDGVLEAVAARSPDASTFLGEIPEAARDPAVAGRWRHFKGGVYEFVALVRSPQEGQLVLYRDASGEVWLRPWGMVEEIVERDGRSQARFVRIED